MIRRPAFFLTSALAAVAALTIAGCGGQSGKTSAGPAVTPVPIGKPTTMAYAGHASALNLAPDPDTLKKWSAGSFSLGKNGPAGSTDFQMLGTGEPQGSNDLYSPVIALSPGKTYVFSMWIDPSHIIAGSGILGIYSPSRTIVVGQTRINSGPAGRYVVTATVPSDQNQVRIDFQPNGLSIANGQTLRVAQPMLTLSTAPNPAH